MSLASHASSFHSILEQSWQWAATTIGGWQRTAWEILTEMCLISSFFFYRKVSSLCGTYLDSVCENTPLLRSFSQTLAFLLFYRKFIGNLGEFFLTFSLLLGGGGSPSLYIGTSYIIVKCCVNLNWLKRGSISCEQFVLAQSWLSLACNVFNFTSQQIQCNFPRRVGLW